MPTHNHMSLWRYNKSPVPHIKLHVSSNHSCNLTMWHCTLTDNTDELTSQIADGAGTQQTTRQGHAEAVIGRCLSPCDVTGSGGVLDTSAVANGGYIRPRGGRRWTLRWVITPRTRRDWPADLLINGATRRQNQRSLSIHSLNLSSRSTCAQGVPEIGGNAG